MTWPLHLASGPAPGGDNLLECDGGPGHQRRARPDR